MRRPGNVTGLGMRAASAAAASAVAALIGISPAAAASCLEVTHTQLERSCFGKGAAYQTTLVNVCDQQIYAYLLYPEGDKLRNRMLPGSSETKPSCGQPIKASGWCFENEKRLCNHASNRGIGDLPSEREKLLNVYMKIHGRIDALAAAGVSPYRVTQLRARAQEILAGPSNAAPRRFAQLDQRIGSVELPEPDAAAAAAAAEPQTLTERAQEAAGQPVQPGSAARVADQPVRRAKLGGVLGPGAKKKAPAAEAPAEPVVATTEVAALPTPEPAPSAATASRIARMCDNPEMTAAMRRSLIDEHKAALLTQLQTVNFSIADHDKIRREYEMWSGIAAKGDGPLPCDVVVAAASRQGAGVPQPVPVPAPPQPAAPAEPTVTAAVAAPAIASDSAPTPPAAAAEATATESGAAARSEPTDQAVRPTGDAFGIQLAAVRSEASAESEWRRLKGAHADLLGSLGLSLEPVTVPDKGDFFRVQARSMSKASAQRLCGELKGRGVDCLVVTP